MLLGHVLALVHPLPVALEEDLEGGPSLTPELDGVALDDVSVDGLLQEVRQRPRLAMLQGFASGTWEITRGHRLKREALRKKQDICWQRCLQNQPKQRSLSLFLCLPPPPSLTPPTPGRQPLLLPATSPSKQMVCGAPCEK